MIIASETDKFGTPLCQGDTIIVCYSRNGILVKATIVGEKGDQWLINVDYGYGTDIRRIDKNPQRMVKYNG